MYWEEMYHELKEGIIISSSMKKIIII